MYLNPHKPKQNTISEQIFEDSIIMRENKKLIIIKSIGGVFVLSECEDVAINQN